MAMFFYSTYIMDDLALAEVASGSLTGDNFGDLSGARFDTQLMVNTAFAPKIRKRQPASYGVVVTYALYNQEDKNKTAAASMFLDYLFTEDAYISYLHMQPGGINPVLKEIAESEKFLNDPKGIHGSLQPEIRGAGRWSPAGKEPPKLFLYRSKRGDYDRFTM